MNNREKSFMQSFSRPFTSRLRHQNSEAPVHTDHSRRKLGSHVLHGQMCDYSSPTPVPAQRETDLADLPDIHEKLVAEALKTGILSPVEAQARRDALIDKEPQDALEIIFRLVDDLAPPSDIPR